MLSPLGIDFASFDCLRIDFVSSFKKIISEMGVVFGGYRIIAIGGITDFNLGEVFFSVWCVQCSRLVNAVRSRSWFI